MFLSEKLLYLVSDQGMKAVMVFFTKLIIPSFSYHLSIQSHLADIHQDDQGIFIQRT